MKRSIAKIITSFLIVLFSSIIIFSLFHIINWYKANKENRKINNYLHEYITVGGKDKYNINFEEIKKTNSDAIAYIKVPGTKIDYIVVKGEDNDFYLNHNFNKDKNITGWIFADYKNNFNNEDKNIVIYGHNTIDKSMFGSLKYTLEKSWQENENNHTIIFVTEEGLKKYKVFSTYKVDNEEYYITTDFTSDNEFKKFLDIVKSRSKYNYNVELNETDHILTLSTCSNQGKKRVVLHAVEIKDNID